MASRPDSKKGVDGFNAYCCEIYGARWPVLSQALHRAPRQVARINKFADPGHVRDSLSGKTPTLIAGCEVVIGGGETQVNGVSLKPAPDKQGIFNFYFMDAASIFAATALEAQYGDKVLDLCAAPGGKSLILAERVFDPALSSEERELDEREPGELTCNEPSAPRRTRLRAVLEDYLPRPLLEKKHVNVAGHDGARWCLHETEAYERILVDAPCSGERHLLANPAELKLWSPARSKNLAVRQYALLTSAMRVVKRGGRVVYSTCSISPVENDGVIARYMKKKPGEARLITGSCAMGEATEFGWTILPDVAEGFGPIYFAVLERT